MGSFSQSHMYKKNPRGYTGLFLSIAFQLACVELCLHIFCGDWYGMDAGRKQQLVCACVQYSNLIGTSIGYTIATATSAK